MRMFFAIKLPLTILDQLAKETASLKKEITGEVKWVNISQMHLTLKFIGEFDRRHTEPIANKLIDLLKGAGTFSIQNTSIGVFPNLNNPRVIWHGLQNNSHLVKITDTINLICSQFGYPKEKRSFSPHLTAGRIKRKVSNIERRIIGRVISKHKSDLQFNFDVSHIYSIKSQLTPIGPIYTDLFSVPLQ